MVVPVDPAGSGVLDVGEGLVGALVEDHRADAFGLEQTDDGFHQAVDAPIAVKQQERVVAWLGGAVADSSISRGLTSARPRLAHQVVQVGDLTSLPCGIASPLVTHSHPPLQRVVVPAVSRHGR